MDDFLAGRNHGEILERLVSLAHRSLPENPRVVVIEGLSGVGKTRIVQELYRTLQAEEATAARERALTDSGDGATDGGSTFWPPLASSENAGRDSTMTDRKRIGPELDGFHWPKNSLPTFAWWAISCDRDAAGKPTDVMSALSPAFREFRLPLRLAARRLDRKGAITDWMHELTEIAKAQVSGFAEDQLISAVASLVPVPGASYAITLGKDLFRLGKRRYSERSAAISSVTLGGFQQNRDDAAALAAELIESMRPGLPTVVVVEDIHLMSASVERFLTGLLAAPAECPVLIVGTAWPHYEQNERYTQWRSGIEATWLVTEHVEGLDEADLGEIVARRAPATSRRVREALAEKYKNPLALKIALSLGPVARSIQGEAGSEAIDLTDEDIRHLPHTMEDLRLAQWNALPSDVKEALAIAAASLGGEDAVVGEFDRELVARAADRASLVAAEAVEAGLREARDPLGWSRSSEAALAGWEQFREPAYAELARAQFPNLWLERHRGLLIEATIGELRAQIAQLTQGGAMLDPRSPHDRHVAAWRVALGVDVETREDVLAQVVSALADYWRKEEEGAGEKLLAVRHAWLEFVDPTDLTALFVRREIIHAVGDVEGWQKAAHEFAAIADEVDLLRAGATGEREADLTEEWLEDRHMAAYATGEAGDWGGAARLFEQIVAERQLILGHTHERTLVAARNCAYAYNNAVEFHKAAEVYERLVEDATTAAGGENDERVAEAMYELGDALRCAAKAESDPEVARRLTARARAVLERSIQLSREHPELDRKWLGNSLHVLGLLLVVPPFPEDDIRIGRACLAEAAEIPSDAEDSPPIGVSASLDMLVVAETVLEHRGELPRGTWLATSERALAVAERCDAQTGGARALRSWKRRAESFRYCGDPEGALPVWRELERRHRERGDTVEADAAAVAAEAAEKMVAVGARRAARRRNIEDAKGSPSPRSAK